MRDRSVTPHSGRFFASQLLSLCFAGVAAAAAGPPVEVDYELKALTEPFHYEYVYTLKNNSLALAPSWFSIDFDTARYDESSLKVTSTGKSSWTEQVLASVPGLPAQYDAYKSVGMGPASGGSESGFTVQFTWLAPGSPGSQAFTIWDASTLDIVTTGVVCVTPEMSTREANELMSEHQVRRLPVVENDRLIGIVSLGDLAVKEGKDRRTGDTLQEISAGVKERG